MENLNNTWDLRNALACASFLRNNKIYYIEIPTEYFADTQFYSNKFTMKIGSLPNLSSVNCVSSSNPQTTLRNVLRYCHILKFYLFTLAICILLYLLRYVTVGYLQWWINQNSMNDSCNQITSVHFDCFAVHRLRIV